MVGEPDIERQGLGRKFDECGDCESTGQSWSNYGPAILSQRSETAFGSHPCRVVSVSYVQILAVTALSGGFGNRWAAGGIRGNRREWISAAGRAISAACRMMR